MYPIRLNFFFFFFFSSRRRHTRLVGDWSSRRVLFRSGVRVIQLSPYRSGVAGPQHTRLLLSPALQPCACPLALSGLGEAFTSQSSVLNCGHLWWQCLPCMTRRTVFPHPVPRLHS